MRKYISDIAFSDKVKELQEQHGSRKNYANMEQGKGWEDAITPYLADFIAERDSFYMATVNGDGQPYIQHRGGPKSFLKVLNEKTLGFADFRGNRQYISYGNLEENDKVCLFFMDYPNRVRIKLWGTAYVDESDATLLDKLTVAGYRGKAERVFIIKVEVWDRNCPQHIVPRFTKQEIEDLGVCSGCEPVKG